ncbi:MAG: dephospho-CoA kinase [Flexilinea sp.]|nr:dephospho-CoA kinase [Flexilinea sp.]
MVIGVTGGIASGKSEVCRILEKKGFIHIDADEVAHEVLELPDVIDKIAFEFGIDVVSADENGKKHIDRKKLGKIVFNNTEQMNILEKITHPRIVQKIKGMISNSSNDYIIEAIEIVSSGLVDICDELWVIHAEPEQQIKRLIENRHLSYEEACSRIKAQENHDWDESKADRVIYSTEPISSMEKQVLEALEHIHKSE